MTNRSRKNAARIMAWILAILMILSLATVGISVLADSCDTKEETDLTQDKDNNNSTNSDGEIDTDDNADTGDDEF